jgi:hypothetical protein
VEAEVGEPFERLTDRAAEPPRPEVVEETERRRLAIESVYTDYLRQKGRIGASEVVTIAYIGAVKGSASIAVTVHLRMSNGDELALSLKRLNALERAKVGYGHARETLESFISEGDSWQAALEIADQTAERLELETDYLIAGEQFKLGARMFKGLHVEIDGEALSFTTPEVVGVGEDFFIMEFMPGSSLSSMFKEMQGRDPESVLRYKTGILAAHVYCIARCLFDYDRHFGQIIAMLQATFAELDFKATPLKPWSDESIEKFGKAIVHAGTGMFFGTPFRQAFRAAQKEQTKSGEKLDPIFGDLNLALVHLNRLVKELPPSAVARAVLSGFIAGVHPTLKQSILSNTSSELNSAVVSLLDPRSAGQNPLVEGLLEGKALLKIWQDAAAA